MEARNLRLSDGLFSSWLTLPFAQILTSDKDGEPIDKNCELPMQQDGEKSCINWVSSWSKLAVRAFFAIPLRPCLCSARPLQSSLTLL